MEEEDVELELELRRSELGLIPTIYEGDELDDDDKNSPPPRVNPLSLTAGSDPDVMIHVQDSCFHLHKEALIARSTYLNLRLSRFTEITLSPPLNITPETFSLTTDFCYGNDVVLTPFNVAALRTAAELLGMTEIGSAGDENLKQKTETYFSRVVSDNDIESASIVLRSCFLLLPEAETAAFLVSRCLEALSSKAEDGFDLVGCLNEFKSVSFEDLQVILKSTSQRLTDGHDLLYTIIDIYLKENDDRKLSDDEKFQLCNYMDCRSLSPKFLTLAVQNPRMPLRFILQAMFLQQLSNRRSIVPAADHRSHHDEDPITHRDAALRQVSHLKAVVIDTSSRIQTLERDMSRMRKLLYEPDGLRSRVESDRSASFRLESETNRVGRGQIGSISSLNVGDIRKKVMREGGGSWNYRESSGGNGRTFGGRVLRALKKALGLQRKKRD